MVAQTGRFRRLLRNITFVLIVPLAAAGWRGGIGNAIVASVTIFLASNYLDVRPYYAFTFSLQEIPRFALILSIALLSAARGIADTRRRERANQQAALAALCRPSRVATGNVE